MLTVKEREAHEQIALLPRKMAAEEKVEHFSAQALICHYLSHRLVLDTCFYLSQSRPASRAAKNAAASETPSLPISVLSSTMTFCLLQQTPN